MAILRAPAISSDYAAQREMVGDLLTALLPIVRDTFAPIRILASVEEPPIVSQLGVMFMLNRDLGDTLSIEMQAKLTDVMDGAAKAAASAFPTIPLSFEYLRPPLAARHGFVAYVKDTAPKPVYPRLIRAKAVLRPTNWLRQRLGLAQLKEG